MEESGWIGKAFEFDSENNWLTTVLVPAVVGFVTTGVMSHIRRPKKTSRGGRYFTSADLLKAPHSRPAYSDRMTYLLAEMSALAYFEFESSSGAMQKAVDRFLRINSGVNNDTAVRVRELLETFRDDLLIKTVDSREFLRQILKITDIKSGSFEDARLLTNPPMIDRIWWMWQHIRKSFLEPVKSHGMAIYRNMLLYLATHRNPQPA